MNSENCKTEPLFIVRAGIPIYIYVVALSSMAIWFLYDGDPEYMNSGLMLLLIDLYISTNFSKRVLVYDEKIVIKKLFGLKSVTIPIEEISALWRITNVTMEKIKILRGLEYIVAVNSDYKYFDDFFYFLSAKKVIEDGYDEDIALILEKGPLEPRERDNCIQASNIPILRVYPEWYMYIIAFLAIIGTVISYSLDIKPLFIGLVILSVWYLYKVSICLFVYEDRIVLVFPIGISKTLKFEDFGQCYYSVSTFSKLKINKGDKCFVRVDYQYKNYLEFANLLWEKKPLSLWSFIGVQIAAEKNKRKN